MPRLWLHRAALSGAEEGVWLTISVPPAGCGTTPDDAHSEISDTVETFRLPANMLFADCLQGRSLQILCLGISWRLGCSEERSQ
jgi:hypothetical protein